MGTAATTVINSGDPLDPAVVDANFSAILAELNGNLQAITNIQIASAVAVTGNQNLAGTSASLAASDHQHIVRGLENLAADPSSGNFAGRAWFDTTTKQWKGISDLSGPTIAVLGNPSATDLVHHASQHVDGAADQLSDTSIAERSMKARTVYSVVQSASVGPLTDGSWTTIADLTAITTTGQQTILVTCNANPRNNGGNGTKLCTVVYRVQDVTAAGVTIHRTHLQQLGVSGGGSDALINSFSFPYTTPATGARTLRLQAYASASGGSGSTSILTIFKTNNAGSEPLDTPTIQAVIL